MPTVAEISALALPHPRSLSFLAEAIDSFWSFPTPIGFLKFHGLDCNN